MFKIQDYMPGIAENLKKEGDGLVEYQELKSRVLCDMDFAKCRLEEQEKYDNNPEPPLNDDGLRMDVPPLTPDEINHIKKFLDDAKDLVATLDEIIRDELNHTVKLTGKMVKFGYVRPAQDGLANAIQEITMPKKLEEDGDDN